MPITFPCPCGKTLRVADEHAGKRVKCPACQAIATAPAPEPVLEVVESPPAPPQSTVPHANPRTECVEYDSTTYGLAGASGKTGEVDAGDGPRVKPLPDFRLGSGRRAKKRNKDRWRVVSQLSEPLHSKRHAARLAVIQTKPRWPVPEA